MSGRIHGLNWSNIIKVRHDALKVIDLEHAFLDDGIIYECSDNDEDVDATKVYVMKGQGTPYHVCITAQSSAGAIWQLYENPSVNSYGTGLPLWNRNRNSADLSGNVFYKDSTLNANGNLKYTVRIGGVFTGGSSTFECFITKPGNDYALIVTSDAANNRIAVQLEMWVE